MYALEGVAKKSLAMPVVKQIHGIKFHISQIIFFLSNTKGRTVVEHDFLRIVQKFDKHLAER